VVLALLLLGWFQVVVVRTVESYGHDSSIYISLAHNILASGRYEFNYTPHTQYPPGFPLVLAGLSLLTGQAAYSVFVRFMPVFSSLALVVWYFVLRRAAGAAPAAAACLLVASSAPLFGMVTQAVNSDAAFFLFSGLAVLSATALAQARAQRVLLGAGLGLATAATVLVRSAGIALAAALAAWAAVELWRRRPLRSPVMVGTTMAAVLGFVGFFGWVGWSRHAEHREYQGQHMRTYAGQLLTRDPHRPDLGTASARDVAARVISNAPVQASHLAAVLSRAGYVLPTWYSPLGMAVLALLAGGLLAYARDSRTTLLAGYFFAYFGLYLFWPFDEGPRFMLPVAPLAFVLMWRGGGKGLRVLRGRPGAALCGLTIAGAALAAAAAGPGHLAGLQTRLALALWSVLAVASLVLMLVVGRAGPARTGSVLDRLAGAPAWRHASRAALAALLAAGLFQQLGMAKANRTPDPSRFLHYRSADCSAWLRTAGEGTVMAQQYAIIHRLTGRKVVGFPISGYTRLIAETVKREHVRYLVVNDQGDDRDEYFWPTEQQRWQQLERSYGSLFRLAHQGPRYRVFEVR
jgi:4-amino-4-deoxy-L-arabinose transferase-like glycosyltransferase